VNRRFLGTPRIVWLVNGLLLLLGLFLIATATGGFLGNVVGVLMVFAAIFLYSAAPMRYGDAGSRRAAQEAAPAPPTPPAALPPSPPRPRPDIEGRDASQV
jgi:hypothetical protein